MNTKDFEKYSQGKLQGYKSNLDAEALWLAIEPQLMDDKRRPFFMYWIFGALFLVAASFAIIPNFYDPNPGPSGQEKLGSAFFIEGEKEKENEDRDVQNYSDQNKGKIGLNAGQEIIEGALPAQTVPPKNQFRESTSNKATVSSISKKDHSVTGARKEKPTTVFSKLEDQNNGQTSVSKTSPTIAVETAQSQEFLKPKDPGHKKPALELPVAAPENGSVIEPSDPKNQEDSPKPEITEKVDQASIMIDEDVEEKSIEEIEEEPMLETPPVEPPPYRQRLLRDFTWGFGIRSGIAGTIRTLTPLSEEGRIIRGLRDDTETKLETLDFGAEVLLRHDDGFYFSVGAEMIRSASRLDFNEFTSTSDSVMGITAIYVSPITGDSVFEMGKVLQTTETFRDKTTYNYATLINIPVMAGYHFNHEQWSFGVEAGAIINVLSSYKGEIRDTEGSFYDLDTDLNDWYKSNVGVSFRGSIQVGHLIGEYIQLFAGPTFRSPVILSDENNPIEQTQGHLGFHLGARYWLE